jgi:hypothetical protein
MYVLSPGYGSIKQGINENTAKLTRIFSPTNLTKWYSVNVTEIAS